MSDLYFALDYCNLDWKQNQLVLVEEFWKRGTPLDEIARLVRRPPREVFVLIFDRIDQGYIQQRKGSIFGDVKQRKNQKRSS